MGRIGSADIEPVTLFVRDSQRKSDAIAPRVFVVPSGVIDLLHNVDDMGGVDRTTLW